MPEIDRITAALSQASIYGALATAFGPNVSPLHDGSLLTELTEAVKPLSNPDLSQALSQIRSILDNRSWTLEDLKLEHTRLFVKGEATPYETSFDKGRPFGKTQDLSDIAGFYMAFGVKPSHELPDYIVCELEFMSLLCVKEGYALAHSLPEQAEVCSTVQRKFIAEHLGRWLASFHRCLKEHAKLPIYAALGELTYRFVKFHADALHVTVADDQPPRTV